jgi:hypothetical protein
LGKYRRFLEVPYINSLRLEYEFFIPEKLYTGLALHHNSASNAIVRKKYLDNGIHYTTYINAANYSAFSASLDCNFNITKWWKISLYGSAVFRAYKDAESAPDKKYTSYSAWFDNTINYNRWWIYFSYFPSIKTLH